MHAEKAIGMLQSLGEFLDREARRIGRKQRPLRYDAVKFVEDLALEFHVFRHGLDDTLGVLKAVVALSNLEAGHRVVAFLLGDSAPCNATVQPLVNRSVGLLDQCVVHVQRLDDEPGGRGRMSNTGAHRAGTDYTYQSLATHL